MTGDEMERAIKFLLEHMGTVTTKLEIIGERLDQLEKRLDTLAEKVDLLADKVHLLADKVDRLVDQVAALTVISDTHSRAIQRLAALSEVLIERQLRTETNIEVLSRTLERHIVHGGHTA